MAEPLTGIATRVLAAGLVSAALGIGGVWFVVDQSLDTLRGHVASIDARVQGADVRLDERFSATDAHLDRIVVRVDERLAAVDTRLDTFVTKREFDQFLDRFTRFEQRVEQQFELTRTTVSSAARGLREGRFRLLDDRIETTDGSITVSTEGLDDLQTGFLLGKLVQRFPLTDSLTDPTLRIEDVAAALDEPPYNAEITGAGLISVRPGG